MTTPKAIRERPIFALLALILFVGGMVFLAAIGRADAAWFMPTLLGSIPSLIAALAAETAVRDIRNGVVKEKAKQGAAEAIVENQVITRDGPFASTSILALRQLLEDIHGTTTETATKVDQVVAEQDRLTHQNGDVT